MDTEIKQEQLSNITWQKLEQASLEKGPGLWSGIKAIHPIIDKSDIMAKGPFYYVGSGGDMVLPIGMAHKNGAVFILNDYVYRALNEGGSEFVSNKSIPDDQLRATASTIEKPVISEQLGKGGKRTIVFSVDGLKMQAIMYGEDATKVDPPEIKEGCAILFISAPTNPYGDEIGTIYTPENMAKLFTKVKLDGFIANWGTGLEFLSILSPEDIGIQTVKYDGSDCPIKLYRKIRDESNIVELVNCAAEIRWAVDLRNGQYLFKIDESTIPFMEVNLKTLRAIYQRLNPTAQKVILNAIKEHLIASKVSRKTVDLIKANGKNYGIISDEKAIEYLKDTHTKVFEFFPELDSRH